MNQISVLVVEDNEDINRILKRFLEQAGYQVKSAFSGTEAQLLFSMEHFHLIILDLMLPGLSGEEIIQEIRKKSQTPIIVISAKSSLEDKVNVLKIGADDYITKPFEREEVLVRIEALLRRCHVNNMEASENNEISFKNLLLKVASREVFVKENPITLTAYEFDIYICSFSIRTGSLQRTSFIRKYGKPDIMVRTIPSMYISVISVRK